MQPFSFATTARIVCAPGASTQLARLCRDQGARSVLLVTDAGIVGLGRLSDVLPGFAQAGVAITVFDQVRGEPAEATVNAAVACARGCDADLVIGFGGGSCLDVAKLTALLAHPASAQTLADVYGVDRARGARLALIQVPTTAGTGSEVTPIAIVTTPDNTRQSVVSPLLLADLALLDVELTLGLAPATTAASGLVALVHAVEAYTSVHNKNPLSDLHARGALRLLGRHLEDAVHDGANRAAREAVLVGACMAGQAFANAPAAAVHALSYPLGGHFQVPHGLSNALLLPHVLGFNAQVAAPLYAELAPVLLGERLRPGEPLDHTEQFIVELADLVERCGLPMRLRDVGVAQDALPRLARDAVRQARLLANNPRSISEAQALAIYQVSY